ncbi:uncharacterized protein L199_004660 [Kwoniella botswanensis]|uniref:uncharacterized protein n=1 Tax=Kwoniella botswanensis TaxID=1268659 RepID=UPI00315D22B3
MLKRYSELESSCDNKDEQIKQITAFLAQAKDLVRGAEQILEGPKNYNTSDSTSSADQAQFQRPATSPRSPGEQDISEVEDATSNPAPKPTSPLTNTIEPEISFHDRFRVNHNQRVAWDDAELTPTDHLTPHLPWFWKTVLKDLESWRAGRYAESILRVLLTSLSVTLLPQHHNLVKFSIGGKSDCNFREVNDPKYIIGFNIWSGLHTYCTYVDTGNEPSSSAPVRLNMHKNGRVSDHFRIIVYITY